jgi:hypothetical protein
MDAAGAEKRTNLNYDRSLRQQGMGYLKQLERFRAPTPAMHRL